MNKDRIGRVEMKALCISDYDRRSSSNLKIISGEIYEVVEKTYSDGHINYYIKGKAITFGSYETFSKSFKFISVIRNEKIDEILNNKYLFY